MKFLFVGERPSDKAKAMNVKWENGNLAAKQLFDALKYCNINPEEQQFINIYFDDRDEVNPVALKLIKKSKLPTVAMGNKVKKIIKCDYEITHPAARGKIRKKQLYCKHVASILRKNHD